MCISGPESSPWGNHINTPTCNGGVSTTVACVLGGGEWATKSLALVRSLQRFSPESNIVLFVPTGEAGDIPDDIEKVCRSTATVVEGQAPIAGYPIATKIAAFAAATTHSDSDRYVLLDTDTLVLESLETVPATELGVRPANFASRRRQVAMGDILTPSLYRKHGFDPPNETIESVVDAKPMVPGWNAGVVTTTDPSLPERWLHLTADVLETLEQSRYADQVALSLLSTELETTVLPTLDNYPGAYRFRFPSAIRVLHYHNFRHILRVFNPTLRRKFRRIGLREIITEYSNGPIRRQAVKHAMLNIAHRVVGW